MSGSGLGQNQELSGLQSLTAIPSRSYDRMMKSIDDKIFDTILLTSKTP